MGQKIIIYHPDPWGNGISLSWCYMSLWDGSIEYWLERGCTATYEDGTPCTHYEGKTLKPVSKILAEAPLTSFSFKVLDFSKV